MLHPARGGRAVLICGPLSDEALNVYRPLVFLGERLAAAGLPTLRLAYYGAGDSAGGDEESGRFDHWLRSIRDGVTWLQEQYGAERVTLVGYRTGASLAARAACDCPGVDSLVLLSPVSGRQALHELVLSARISQRVWQTSHKVDDGTWFESYGLRIDRATRDALNALDIRKLPARPAEHALIIEAEARPATAALAEALRQQGTAVTLLAAEDFGRMQRDSHLAEVPHDAFGRIAAWVQALPPTAQTDDRRALAIDAVLRVGPAREMPVYVGPDERLFGVLSIPDRRPANAPAVLLVNTSANPRWGNARIAVDVARELAADGIASLRIDASGMGDAAPDTGEVGRPYAEAITRDVLQAARELGRRAQGQVIALGICSGAYHALEAARRDAAIDGLVLVNLQRFVWREGDPPDAVRRTDLRPTRFYLRNIVTWQAWMRLLRADFDVINLARVLMLRVMRRGIAGLDPVLALLLGGATRVGRVRQAMRALAQRRMPVLYVLGYNDPGVEELAEYFGRDGVRLRQHPNVTMTFLKDSDHTLGAAAVRAELIGQIRAWCHAQWPAVDRAAPVPAPVARGTAPRGLSPVAPHG